MHSRTYSYESPNYSSGQVPPSQDGRYPTPAPSYDRSYNQHPGQYYIPEQTMDVGTQPNPYFRSMTPMVSSSHRSGDERYYHQPPGGGASSSHINPSAYPPQAQYYSSQYPSARDHRSRHSGAHPPEGQFIPTPSEMYSNYPPRQISVPPQSPNSQDVPYTSSQYPQPAIVPSSRSASQRPTRISTSSRPHTASAGVSPTSASSSSGERFPCDRCGKTFSRSHDRKRHHETQHLSSPVIHRCRFCEKEFSRADSLKRHLDNGCDEMPS